MDVRWFVRVLRSGRRTGSKWIGSGNWRGWRHKSDSALGQSKGLDWRLSENPEFKSRLWLVTSSTLP